MSELVKYAVTVGKDRQTLYSFWRDFENLPRFSRHLLSVRNLDDRRSEWTTEGPQGPITWTAEIIEDIPGEHIGWRSLPGSDVDHHGIVQFLEAPGGRGTEIRLFLSYQTPFGILGKAVANLTGNEPKQEVAETLRRFKSLMECGEIPVIEGQPSNIRRGDNLPGDPPAKVGPR